MDTTLMTFHLRTPSPTRSVHLIGSWDNFTKQYAMERDTRRASNQWRGCYRFEDIICDGESGVNVKRTGGLQMGSTYYYYYKLDDDTETHDTSLPSTTSCPYMPGQPVNFISVPVEVHSLRYRSASMSSMAAEDKMTMNPADKFMAPRPPPPRPILGRLKTAPSMSLMKKRSARSLSPAPVTPKTPWSPRSFFGLRSPFPQEVDKRGRSNPGGMGTDSSSRYPSLTGRLEEDWSVKFSSKPRDTSPRPIEKTQSREPSPLRNFTASEPSHSNDMVLTIPDIDEDDAEDDANFADHLHRISLVEKSILTPLAPTPSVSRFPQLTAGATNLTKDLSKPLPLLPEQFDQSLIPSPLRLRHAELPGSHFSISTTSTSVPSPTDSHFSYSDTPSFGDEEDLSLTNDGEDDSTFAPLKDFPCYSLPEVEQEELTIGKASGRDTFGGAEVINDEKSLSTLQELLLEMEYLGEFVSDK